jgi:TonB-linked SusC/RagA family outer membrane protein
MRHRIFTTLFAVICCLNAFAQDSFHGRVTDAATGKSLAGATITLVKNKYETASDKDGFFEFYKVTLPDTLVVTYIGYDTQKQPVNLASTRELVISLIASSVAMSEVTVSTGYQTLPRERSTGSFTVIGKQKFNEQVSTDVLSRLESIASGLTFNRSTSGTPLIQIRGLSTIKGPASPLIVLDNFPYEGDLSNINPNDVENITILKDAAAASIWGTKAGNGVIVITTKKARFNQKVTAEFNANVTVGNKPDLSYIRQISSSDFIDVEKYLFSKGFYDANLSGGKHPGFSPVVELLSSLRNGTETAVSVNNQIDQMRNHDVRDDFNKYMYRNSVNQQYSLNLKGGSDIYSWLFSSGYDQNVSSLAAGNDRLNLNFQQTFRPVSKLQVSTSFYYTQNLSAAGRPGYGEVPTYNNFIYPYARLADDNGSALPIVRQYSLSYLNTVNPGFLDWKYYPLNDYKNTENKTNIQDIVARLSANYSILPSLNFSLQYQYERQDTHNKTLQSVDSYYTRDLINRFTEDDGSGELYRPVPLGGILSFSDSQLQSHNVRGQLSFDKTWNKNSINAIGGAEIRQTRTDFYSNQYYGYDTSNLTSANVDYLNVYPNFVTGFYDFIPDNKFISARNNRFVSFFANAVYTYYQKYSVSFSGRRDASNLFGVNTNDKWNPLGSVGLGWEVTKENFFHPGFLSYLKLRATYGLSGNSDLSQTAVTTLSYLGNSPYTLTPWAVFNTYGNPDLKWETSAMYNLGLDFSAFNNRLTGTIEYYHKKGTNLFGLSPIDYTTGTSTSIVKNTASTKGRGVDITVNSININAKFKWTSSLNASFNNDEVTEYYLNNQNGNRFIGPHPAISGIAGKPVYSIFSFRSAGLDPANGNPRGYVNGQISEDYSTIYNKSTLSDLKYHGSALPTKFGSFNNTFTYSNISLSITATYKLGYYFRRSSISYIDLYNTGLGNSDFSQRWQKSGDELQTTVPSMVYPGNATRDAFYRYSESLVDKADHIRLQYITLSYLLEKKKFRQLPFNTLQVYGNASNLGLVWTANKSHIDPDYSYGDSALKPPLTLSLGIKGSF